MFKNLKPHRAFGIIAVICVLIALPISASAVEYRGIGGQPANPRADNPRSSSIFIYELKPGESVRDAIIVRNGTDKAHNILVYPVDPLVSSGGAFACEQKAEKADEVGSWITMDKTEVLVPAQGSATVGFTLKVPQGVDVGEHNGCITIQSGTQAPEKDVNGLTLSFRSALRVAITVPGVINKALDITKLEAQKAADKQKQGVKAVFRNRGNVSLDTDVTVKLGGLLGRQVDKIDGTYAMLSGTSTELNFELKRPIIPWIYTVNATGKYNDDPKAGLGVKADKTKMVSESITLIIWPSLKQLAISLLILAVVFAVLARFIHRRHILRRQQKTARNYTVKSGDTIESVAQKMSVSWYDIALLNKLKAPYKLKKGKRIYVPAKAKPKPTKPKSKKSKK